MRGQRLWTHTFSVLSLLMVLLPLSKTMEVSFVVWPFVFLIDLLAVILAILAGTLLPIVLVLLATLAVLGAWIARIPMTLDGLPTSLMLLGGFAVFFLLASVVAARALASSSGPSALPGSLQKAVGNLSTSESLAALLPASACVLPFLLLMMVTTRLPIADPSPVFGLALILGVLLLGVTRILRTQGLPLCALLSTVALEHAWHFTHFDPRAAALPLGWYLAFYAIFTLYPFIFEKGEGKAGLSWTAAALAGPVHFHLVLKLIRSAYPNLTIGLVPAAFAMLSFCGFIFLLQRIPQERRSDNSALAWFGGVSLYFFTLIFHNWLGA
jgi:hypothetical protein